MLRSRSRSCLPNIEQEAVGPRSIAMNRLDGLVTTHFADRLLGPTRLAAF
ncbi:MAG: hypothetical protein WBO09_07990 [Methylocystis silviterrae]